MEFETYDLNISKDLFNYILSSYSFLKHSTRVGKDNFIGYNHKITKGETLDNITPLKAKDLFYKDIKDIENYTLIKSIKSKIDSTVYEVLVHFCFDYGKNVLKNSKFYFYVKQNNKVKIIEELEKYKTYKTTCKKNISKRSFDIFLINNGTYINKDTNNGNKKRSSSKNVGFRF